MSLQNLGLIWVLLVTTFIVTWLLTRTLRKYAIANQIVDIPNARSSHSVPTPRGGGVAIVVSFLLLLPILGLMNWLDWYEVFGVGGAGLGIAALGFVDDHGHVAAKWRLLGHFAAAAWVLFWIGGLPTLEFFGATWNLGWFGSLLAAFYLVWLLNLYNFMDGIDGIASVEAVFVTIGGASFYIIGDIVGMAVAPALLACAVAGFLCWNFPPAKIFMGDAGSGFLGIVLGFFTLQAAWAKPELLWAWLILLGVFVVDASLTLFRRLLRGEKVYEAHRSHSYQRAARRYGGHLPITLGVVVLNIAWLYPLAFCVAADILDGLTGVIIAYLPLILLAFAFGGGKADTTIA